MKAYRGQEGSEPYGSVAERLPKVEAADEALEQRHGPDLRKKMRAIHDEVPPDYYDSSMAENPFQRFWHSRRISAITNLLKGEDARMLDIGCGGGTLLDRISVKGRLKWSAGVDASQGAIKYATEAHRGPKFLCADFYELPFEDNSFGFISAIEVLEHLHEPREALIELNRCLEDRGKILVLVPNE